MTAYDETSQISDAAITDSLVGAARDNYASTFTAARATLRCYAPNQMKSLYPAGGYSVIAEYVPGGKAAPIAMLSHGNRSLPVAAPGSTNRFAYKTVGYVAVAGRDDAFVAVRKSVLGARVVIIVASLAAIAGILYALFLMPGAPLRLADLDPNAVDWKGTQTEAPATVKGIKLPGYKSLTVQSGKREVVLNLHNPKENDCLLVMRLSLVDSGETLFESKMIEPGKGLYGVNLSRPLKPGTYAATLQYEAYDRNTLTRLNGASMNLNLIAE